MVTVEDNRWTQAWRALGDAVDQGPGRPRAVLMVSAHWNTRGCAVTAMPRPRTIHDFGGFPRPLYEIAYPAPGAPWLADRVAELLAPVEAVADHAWGLDHGSWAVLRHAWPAADVPVVQLSLDLSRPPAWHLARARSLAPLRDEGVLIAGSGNVVHNLSVLARQAPQTGLFDWAERFEAWVRERALAGDADALAGYASRGEDAARAVPTPEHYLPLLYVMGVRQEGEPVSFPVDGGQFGAISMLGVRVG